LEQGLALLDVSLEALSGLGPLAAMALPAGVAGGDPLDDLADLDLGLGLEGFEHPSLLIDLGGVPVEQGPLDAHAEEEAIGP